MVQDQTPMSKLEVSAEELRQELEEIRQRLGIMESLLAFSGRKELTELLRSGANSSKHAKRVLYECLTPKTRAELVAILEMGSPQNLDHSLRPLKQEYGLLEETRKDGSLAYEVSHLVKKLPKKTVQDILKA